MTTAPDRLALWGGVECTVNRVHDCCFNQLERSGHASRIADLDLFASLGITALRYPALWELTAPKGIEQADWSWLDARLPRLRALGIEPILGLVHHGSGPRHTSLLDPQFASGLASYAGAVARRYPWVRDYTPVNEPNTTARFSALYGVWYPHDRSDAGYVRALLNECRATALAMKAIREVNPAARLVQTDDLGKTYSRPVLADIAEFYNERRWLGWDLLCGRVDAAHPMYPYLCAHGASEDELGWFRCHPCPPDVIGINYYITGERLLDERVERFPAHHCGGSGERRFADIEIARALDQPLQGVGPLLAEAWQRYGLPLAVTEVHIDGNREDQLRWITETWHAATCALHAGQKVEAVTVWALLGSFDWNTLVTQSHGYYEPGAFEVRSGRPRATAVAMLMRELSSGRAPSHPVHGGLGWWRRDGRFLCEPVEPPAGRLTAPPKRRAGRRMRPLLITGARGTLGRAFARICAWRDLSVVCLGRQELDITDASAVAQAFASYQPWGVINACGYVRVDDAERDAQACLRVNAMGAEVLARQCAAATVPLLSFSSDLVFDGLLNRPYVETDAVNPLNVYGRSKVEAERRMLGVHDLALVVRTSAFFGPWDDANFIAQGLRCLSRGEPVVVSDDVTVSPTYVPDLVHACLDLLIDGEAGVWHLCNEQAVTWAGWLNEAARRCGIDVTQDLMLPGPPPHGRATLPRYSALASVHGPHLPTLDSAMERFCRGWCDPARIENQAPVAVRRGVA